MNCLVFVCLLLALVGVPSASSSYGKRLNSQDINPEITRQQHAPTNAYDEFAPCDHSGASGCSNSLNGAGSHPLSSATSQFSGAASTGSVLHQPLIPHQTLVTETKDTDYPRGHLGVQEINLNPAKSGLSHFDTSTPLNRPILPLGSEGTGFDVHTSTSSSPNSIPPSWPSGPFTPGVSGYGQTLPHPPGYPLYPGYFPSSGDGTYNPVGFDRYVPSVNDPTSGYPYPPRGAPGYMPPTSAYPYPPPFHYATPHSSPVHDAPCNDPSHTHPHSVSHSPSYSTRHPIPSTQPHAYSHAHNHLDHTLKLNNEYSDVGQHLGPLQGANGYGYGYGYGSGYGGGGGYNGAYNRPMY